MPALSLTLADEAFLLVAELHRRHPEREDFRTAEVIGLAQVQRFSAGSMDSLKAHLSTHTVANKAPDPDKHRMLFSTGHGRLRLLQPGDEVHPLRTGKQFPDESQLDTWGAELVRWAKDRYEKLAEDHTSRSVRGLLDFAGISKGTYGDVDRYVQELRKGWDA